MKLSQKTSRLEDTEHAMLIVYPFLLCYNVSVKTLWKGLCGTCSLSNILYSSWQGQVSKAKEDSSSRKLAQNFLKIWSRFLHCDGNNVKREGEKKEKQREQTGKGIENEIK